MAGKKHPILTVLIILGVIGLLLGVSIIIVLTISEPSSSLSFKDKIGIIPIDGTISVSRTVTTQLVRFKKDKNIKAIILRINSPGGLVGPTQEIYREVRKTIKTKKVIASMGSVAASGGYYIAAGANRIVANPGTITGSIGVIMEFFQIQDLLNKIGIKPEVLKSGEFKDTGSPHRKMTKREKELINALINDIQKQFVEGVANGRNLSVEKVQQIADGRIFSGSQAKELGLVDILGNFQDAVELAKKMVNIKGDVSLVYPKRTKMGLLDLFLDSVTSSITKLLQDIKPRVEYRWRGFLAPSTCGLSENQGG
ncbi:MAG TPA: signal peptide peptidase SppA [Desulfobacteraceae bacterium]|nr:signal peptide peptidase SppA [Desulfobacteraceae bacterium]